MPKGEEDTSEIDVIFISQKGIFGNEKDIYWTQSLKGGIRERFYNPIKQNNTHIKWLRESVVENIPLFSIVAFSERCTLKKVTLGSVVIQDGTRRGCSDVSGVWVINRDYLYATIRKLWDSNEDAVDDEGINDLYLKLFELTKLSKNEKQAHIDRINKK